MKSALKPMFTRIENAIDGFISTVMEQFGTTLEDAEKVLRVFKMCKVVKLDASMGRYNLTHGAYWDKEVIQNAINLDESQLSKNSKTAHA
jgi:hypothetical protein